MVDTDDALRQQLRAETAERQRLQEALRLAEEQVHILKNNTFEQVERAKQEWEASVDSLSQLVCLLDSQGLVLRANWIVEAWQLDSVVKVKGRAFHDLLHPHCTDPHCYLLSFWRQAKKNLIEGQPVALETMDRHLNRYVKLQLQSVAAQRSRRRKAADSFAVLVVYDITQEHIARQQFQQQERLAVVGQLAGGIAHYFNNILTSVIGLAELLRLEANLSPSARQDLALIVQQGYRAADLTRQFLDFSRRSISRKQNTDLANLLTQFVNSLLQSSPAQIGVDLQIEPGPPYLFSADPNQIYLVLNNLALNAFSAMPEGGKLHFRLSFLSLNESEAHPYPPVAPGSWLVLSVLDTGAGILPEHIPHLFEPFFTTKELGQGIGLGLAQVYGIVKQHHGEIKVESQVGQGTIFTLYFPAIA